MTRALVAIPIVVLTAWLGSVLAGCLTGPNCHCPPANAIAPGTMIVKRSTRPELIGAKVDVEPGRVVIHYVVDNNPREIVFSGKPH